MPRPRTRSSRPRRRAETSLPLVDGRLTLAVIADTHGRPHPSAPARVAERAPDAILHAGDVGDLEALAPFEEIASLIAVRGNIDERSHLPDDVVVSIEDAGRLALRILLTHIAVRGPKIRADAARRAEASGAGLVVCGHSHVPFVGRDRGLTVFNPGSIGPRRFRLPIVFGVMTLADGRLSMTHVDCETGAEWAP